jgi:hypothetical protein
MVVVALLAVEGAVAGELAGLELRLSEARKKLDLKPKVESRQEPESTPYTEFGPLVDEAYEALERELKVLLREGAVTEAYRSRLDQFVRSVALAAYLDPSDSAAELAYRLFQSSPSARRKAFEQSIEKLDAPLKKDFRRVMKIQERVAREGNG